jgi:hypothetical protein
MFNGPVRKLEDVVPDLPRNGKSPGPSCKDEYDLGHLRGHTPRHRPPCDVLEVD